MKKLTVIAMCLALAHGASAQSNHTVASAGVHRVYIVRPAFGVGFGFYSPFYSPFGYYGLPYGYPYGSYYPYGAYSAPSKLQKKEADIRADYADRIYSVRKDSSLSSKEKREAIRSLKKLRKQDIKDLVANYHRQPPNEQ
jgi:hypothetical protein